MSKDHLLLIINRWKNETYNLSHQLKSLKSDYEKEYFHLQQKLNQCQYENILLKNSIQSLPRNFNQSTISHQISILCQVFIHNLNTLLLSEKTIDEKQESIPNIPPIIENIETNIKQIGYLINNINENCSNHLKSR
ncbi:unnamed protein product [Adineta steineri]|uniref:Uncharacterized protein n=1 Tax=Adineta steineri TaxID=433720 RepID=A0A819M4X6_9BILA|nr:unnamed protein product [Adineta steineri]CAF3973755.1 unnamed protein product [Adineta steineri]CAF4379572.1 unnamed protein product [Adineta steineri]